MSMYSNGTEKPCLWQISGHSHLKIMEKNENKLNNRKLKPESGFGI
jgi:hypothetical protein